MFKNWDQKFIDGVLYGFGVASALVLAWLFGTAVQLFWGFLVSASPVFWVTFTLSLVAGLATVFVTNWMEAVEVQREEFMRLKRAEAEYMDYRVDLSRTQRLDTRTEGEKACDDILAHLKEKENKYNDTSS